MIDLLFSGKHPSHESLNPFNCSSYALVDMAGSASHRMPVAAHIVCPAVLVLSSVIGLISSCLEFFLACTVGAWSLITCDLTEDVMLSHFASSADLFIGALVTTAMSVASLILPYQTLGHLSSMMAQEEIVRLVLEGKVQDLSEERERRFCFSHPDLESSITLDLLDVTNMGHVCDAVQKALCMKYPDFLEARIEAKKKSTVDCELGREISPSVKIEKNRIAALTLYGQFRHEQLQLIECLEKEEGFHAYVQGIRGSNFPELQAFLAVIDALYIPKLELSIWDQHSDFIFKLRAALDSFKDVDVNRMPAKYYLQAICYARYTAIDLNSYYEEMIPEILGKRSELHSIAELQQEIFQTADRLKARGAYGPGGLEPVVQKVVMTAGEGDPTAEDNSPHVRCRVSYRKDGKEKNVTIVRHGTPTIESGGICKICPEYEAYIEFAKSKGKKILHVIYEGSDTLEMARVNVRLALAQKYDHYFTLRLPLDGPFFNGAIAIDDWEFPQKTNEFHKLKEALVRSFFEPKIAAKTGIMVSDQVREKLSKESLEAIFDEVLTTFIFPGKEAKYCLKENMNLDRRYSGGGSHREHERDVLQKTDKGKYQATIVLFYTLLTHHLQFAVDADHVKTPCKYDMDRGGLMKTFGEVYRSILLDKENDSNTLHGIFMQTVMATFHVKRRGIIPDRGALLHVGLDYLGGVGKIEKERLKRSPLHLGNQITGMEFPSGTGFPLHPIPQIAHSMEEYDGIVAQFLAREGDVIEGTIEAYVSMALGCESLGIIAEVVENQIVIQQNEKQLYVFDLYRQHMGEDSGAILYYWGCAERAPAYFKSVISQVAAAASTGGKILSGLATVIRGMVS